MGNPVSYRGYTTSFEGKQLVSAVKSGKNITFAYDENGLRTQKTVNGVTTNYYYNGSVLISQVSGNDTLLFSYDANGSVVSVNFNGTDYYYIRNGQGDVIKLIDGSGNTVTEYAYDTWGKLLSCTGSLSATLGTLNPFRYRGYVYDTETGWYYLQSRYYDPEVGRFLSADVLLSTGQGVLGHNMFAYCRNNPISRVDALGKTDENIGDGDLIEGGESDDDPYIIRQQYLDYLLNSLNNNMEPLSFDEFVDKQIEKDVNTYVIAYDGYNANYGRLFRLNIFVDFQGWTNLREEISLTSIDEIVDRIVKTAREKYKNGFGEDFFYSEKTMKRKVKKALISYLSAYEESFFGRLFKRPFPFQFADKEEVIHYFGHFTM